MSEIPPEQSASRSDDVVLSADDCLLYRGALAHPGRLSLTDTLLMFSPRNALDRLVGALDFVIPVDQIIEIAAGGVGHNLDIATDEQNFRFSGRGAMRVHARLVALMVEFEGVESDEPVLFEPGERVLVQGQGDLYMNELMAVRGEITMTDRRFRFMPGVGLERLLWSAAQLDVRLDELLKWEIQGIRRLLFIVMAENEVRIGGALAHDLFEQINALRTGNAHRGTSADDAVLETWKASLRHGLIAHPGKLTISPSVLSFQPTGLLDAIVGVKNFSIPTVEITTICVRGWSDKRLHIKVGHQTHALSVTEPEKKADELVDLIRSRYARLNRDAGRGRPRYLDCLDWWAKQIQYDDSEQIVVSGLAVEILSRTEMRFGWLLLSRSRMMFLPIGGPATREDPLLFSLDGLYRLDGGPRTPMDQVYLSFNEKPHRFLLAPSEGLVDEFWDQCRAPSRVLPWNAMSPKALSRITGEARFLRISVHGDNVVDMAPAVTVPHTEGVAMMLPGEPGTSIPLETWVTVEIGQAEGIYQFDSQVVRSAPLPIETNLPNPDQLHLLITAFPTELRIYNKRDSYRIPTHMHLRAHSLTETADGGSWMATGDAFECDLLDLSIGGCLLRSLNHFESGQRVTLNLPLMDQWVEIRATCVRSGEPDPDHPGRWYGMEFRELSMAQEDVLHKSIMSLQREAIEEESDESDEADGEPFSR
jgi:c-di-GMP-binding flagellar brake protein YcgR